MIGVFAAVFSFIFIIMLGISRQFFGRLRLFLSFSPCLKNVVPPTLGGLMIGMYVDVFIFIFLFQFVFPYGILIYFW